MFSLFTVLLFGARYPFTWVLMVLFLIYQDHHVHHKLHQVQRESCQEHILFPIYICRHPTMTDHPHRHRYHIIWLMRNQDWAKTLATAIRVQPQGVVLFLQTLPTPRWPDQTAIKTGLAQVVKMLPSTWIHPLGWVTLIGTQAWTLHLKVVRPRRAPDRKSYPCTVATEK